jgi:GNAT superfamily N-acetyltransferase
VLCYDHTMPIPDAFDLGGLTVDGFDAHFIDDFVGLFESAYMQLNLENGWDTKSYSRNAESFCRQLIELHERQLLKSFWNQGVLLGCYIIGENFINDIVIHPDFQNRGYGSLILRHCLRFMRKEKGVFDIYLRVARSNEGAKRLYERNGFCVISHFAEHTYQG